MSYDLIIFGATGYTGKTVVLQLLRVISEYGQLRWALSARSQQKLDILVADMKNQGYDISNIPVILADVQDEKSLKNMTRQTKVLVNCVGPYTTNGEIVVKTCIETGTHYLDITAEINFIDDIIEKYHKNAEDANVLIIYACGFGSVPGDLGMAYLQQNIEGELQLVKSYNEFTLPRAALIPGHTLLHYGTWESLIYVLADYHYSKHKYQSTLLKKEDKGPCIHRKNGKWWMVYPGPDEYIIEKSQLYLAKTKDKKAVPCRSYTTFPSLFHLIIIAPAFLFLYFICRFSCIKNLVLKYPRLFSFGYFSHNPGNLGKSIKYQIDMEGYGEENGVNQRKNIKLKVSGVDPAYGTTAMMFILCALTLLTEQSKIPSGGVLSTAAAFYDTTLVQKLNKNGIKFEITETKD